MIANPEQNNQPVFKIMEQQLNIAHQFVKEIQKFRPFLDKIDPYWLLLFSDAKDNWNHLYVSVYNKIFRISHSNSSHEDLEIEPNISIKVKDLHHDSRIQLYEDEAEEWFSLIQSAIKWLEELEKDWFKTNLKLQKEYPYDLRYGTIDFEVLSYIVPSIKGIEHDLQKTQIDTILGFIEDDLRPFNKEFILSSMTVKTYLQYCRTAYLTYEKPADSNLSNKELYLKYADGRHEGLLDINPDSEEEFEDWFNDKHPKRTRGGHPWEIVRGGSYNHIGLRIMRTSYSTKTEYHVELYGFVEFRAAEYLSMYIALREAGFPIKLNQAENIKKRLLGQYRVGIIPSYESAAFSKDAFPEEDNILSSMYFEEIEQYQEKLLPFICWKHLPLLLPF